MSARIHVERNGESKKVIQIERISSRVGGAAPSDIILSGLPPHVFSLEFHDNSYWVLNTGNETLYLDENVIPPSSQMSWEPGEVLQVGKKLTLSLEFDGDPLPKPQRRTLLGIRPRALLTAEEQADRDYKVKLGLVLVFSMIGILFFSYQIVFSKPDPDRRVRAELNEILLQLDQQIAMLPNLPTKQNETSEIKDLSDALKRARVAELDRDSKKALSTYAAIRNHIRDRYRTAGEEFSDSVFYRVHEFVWSREKANGLALNEKIK